MFVKCVCRMRCVVSHFAFQHDVRATRQDAPWPPWWLRNAHAARLCYITTMTRGAGNVLTSKCLRSALVCVNFSKSAELLLTRVFVCNTCISGAIHASQAPQLSFRVIKCYRSTTCGRHSLEAASLSTMLSCVITQAAPMRT